MRTESARPPHLVAEAPAIRRLLGGRYQLLGLLREGGDGVVHRARDVRLEREVAISFLVRERERSPGRESVETTIALAEHPRVVTVHDIGEDDGRVFLVSEMMAGTLRDALADGAREALPAHRALRIADQVCQALEHLHARGFVHGRVSADHVWLTKDGFAKLASPPLGFSPVDAAQGSDVAIDVRGVVELVREMLRNPGVLPERPKDVAGIRHALRRALEWNDRAIAIDDGAPERGFVGREREVATLVDMLDGAIAGQGRLVLIGGDDGMGKTLLAEHVLALARRRGAQTSVGRCHEASGAPAFWPWAQILRGHVGDVDVSTLLAAMERGAAAPAPGEESETARFLLFDSITRYLRGSAESESVVILLEDLQWADKPSLLLLQFVARELGDSRLLLLATYCDVEAADGAPFVDLLPNLRRSNRMRTLELHGFDDSGVKRLLESCGAAGLPSSLVRAIALETQGNPFFVQETWRHLCDERIVVRERGGWRSTTGTPSIGIAPGLREILERRLARLSEECRKVLSAAAVVGRVFAAGFLAELDGVGSATEVRDRLDEAIRARVVLRVPKVLDRYAFSHELVREALYGGLPSTQRRKLHRTVARALSESACESRLSEISYHSYEAAKAGIGVEEAADYARRAGEHAQARLAWEEAALQFRRALDLGGPDDAHRLATLSELGGAELRGGNRSRARQAFEEAIALARSRGDAVAMARAAIECAGPPMLGMGGFDEGVIAMLEEALHALGDQDPPLRIRLLSRHAVELYARGDLGRAGEESLEAVNVARGRSDPATLAWALGGRRYTLSSPLRDPRERYAAEREILLLARQIGQRELVVQAHGWCIHSLLELGDVAAVDREIAARQALIEELRQPVWQAIELCGRAMRATLDGRFDAAESLADQYRTLAQKIEHPNVDRDLGTLTMRMRFERGRVAELLPWLEATVREQPSLPSYRAALAMLYAELDCETAARSEFEALAANDFSTVPEDLLWLATMSDLAEVASYLGDGHRAAALYDRLRGFAGRIVVVPEVSCAGPIVRALALLAATEGRYMTAIRHFEEALATCRDLGARPLVARNLYDYGRVLLATGDRERALEMLERAADAAAALGMEIVADKARRLYSAASLRRC